ncbi:Ada metal-binding domain-containing protein [Methanobrevibacter sp.]|uniref:Ada metal-binding domain-containing protein n=1 Tax=Methanobrevibacter sp. TaxID=66852 RepID=UPI0025F8F6A4|nr:Ada metal-binding domain-containing protein [uncultured Methanobrevibacter sp.]
MNNKLVISLIFIATFLICASPVMAAEDNINSFTEFSLNILDIFNTPPSVDIDNLFIEKEAYKHTDSNGKVDKKTNYYINFNLNDVSEDELDVVVVSYDKNGKVVNNTTELISGSQGNYRIHVDPSSDIKSFNLTVYNGNTIVFEGNSTNITKTTDEQVDEPVQEQTDDSSSSSVTYVASSKAGKFHNPGCEWAQKISSSNKVVFHSRDDAINSGYVPCKVCSP